MPHLRSFVRRLRGLFFRSVQESEMAEELRGHVDELMERNIRDGMSPTEARQAAARTFGGVAQVAEKCRDERRSLWVEQVWQDLRHGLRMLGRDPRFTAAAVVTLALGIGANTAVFSVLHAVLVRPLPYVEPERLVSVAEHRLERNDRGSVSSGTYLDWREQNAVFESIAAYGSFGATMKGAGQEGREGAARSVSGARVTPGLPGLLGGRPLLGTGFTGSETTSAGPREILLSHGLWQARFGGRPEVVGTTVQLNDEPATIVGVMPAGFEFPARNLDFWLGLRFDAEDRESRRTREWRVLGRLKPGVSVGAAQAAMSQLATRSAAAHPENMQGWGVAVTPYRRDLVGQLQPLLLLLGGVVALVLLLACTNVANLTLARAVARQREIAIRGALGAGRSRLVRQLFTEAVLLTALGAAVGTLLATWMVGFLGALVPANLPGIARPALDGAALGFSAGVLLLATIIVGLAPAWWLSRHEPRAVLQGGRGSSGGLLLRRTRSSLLVAQLAVATILLVGAALLLRTMRNLQQVDLGFDPQRLLAATVNLPDTRYRTVAEQAAVYERLQRAFEAVPGVIALAGTSDPPLASSSTFSYVVEGRPREGANPRENPVEVRNVTPAYFKTIQLPLAAGRDFSGTDHATAPTVAIVNRAFARLHFPGGDAVGRRIGFTGHGGPWLEIVGVAGDVRDTGSDQPAAPAIYMPYAQKRVLWQSALTILLRTPHDSAQLADEIRRTFAAVDPEFTSPRLASVPALYAARFQTREFMTRLLGGFALLAITLSAVGLYSLIAYSVAQRQREFGIRLALGAQGRNIVRHVMRDGLVPVLGGLAAGLAGALALTRFLSALLFEIQPNDITTLAAVAVGLLLISLLALWLPARQAARVDPTEALRAE